MSRAQFDLILSSADSSSWHNIEIFSGSKDNDKESNDCCKTITDIDKSEEPKFKNTVKKVIKRIKGIAKGLFVEDTLPDPDELPVELPNVINFHSKPMAEEPHFSANFQGLIPEDIYLNNSLSSKGFCIVYRDVKTKNCRVEEISNEFSCRGFFEWFSCYHVMPDSAQIIIFDLNLKVVQAFHFLLRSNVRAAPIWDRQRNQFVAMITITDFIKFLHQYYITEKDKIDNLKYQTIGDWLSLIKPETNTQLISISPECNLKNAVSIIGKNNIHRLPVVDPFNGNLLSIITNSQLFRFFYRKYNIEFNLLNPNYMAQTPTDLGLGRYNNSISTINPWQTIYDAFEIFIHNQISVLPVVDEDAKLLDIFARYDIVALAQSNKYKNLDLPISEALKLRRLIRPPCTCSKENSLREIMELIYKAQVHRVFIVDEDKHILGIISLSDILAFLCDM